jgi:hypothetical protein
VRSAMFGGPFNAARAAFNSPRGRAGTAIDHLSPYEDSSCGERTCETLRTVTARTHRPCVRHLICESKGCPQAVNGVLGSTTRVDGQTIDLLATSKELISMSRTGHRRRDRYSGVGES